MRRSPLSYGAAAELVPLMQTELELCQVQAGEVVAIHSDYQSHPHYPAAVLGAALSLGAHPYQVWTTASASGESAAVQRAWEGSGLIVDLRTRPGLGATPLANAALRAGRRILVIGEPADVLQRLFPDPATVARVRAGASQLGAGKVIKITSQSGSDLSVTKGDRPGVDQYGYSDVPGRWDRWPSSRVVCATLEDSADGRIAVQPGDLWVSWGRYVETRVVLHFAGGRLRTVDGDGPDGVLMREWWTRPADSQAHVLAGVSWGYDARARWERIAMRFAEPGGVMEAASRDGAIMLIFGDNTSPMMGGRNVTAARFAIALRGHTIALDGNVMVRNGKTQP